MHFILLIVFIAIENIGNNLNVCWLDTGQIHGGPYIQWDSMHHEKGRDSSKCSSIHRKGKIIFS